MEKSYYLDLTTLLNMLPGQSAILRTTVPHGVGGLPGPCRGFVWVQDGKIMTCSVEGSNSVRVHGERAWEHLRSLEAWSVTLERQDQEHSLGQRPLSNAFSPPPPVAWQAPSQHDVVFRQQGHLDMTRLRQLPGRERMVIHMVFTLINGKRRLDDIKKQVALSPETVEKAVAELQRLHVIVPLGEQTRGLYEKERGSI